MSEKVMELKDRVQEVIEMIRPSLQADGGDIELVDVVDNIAQVKLQGACGVCPSSIYTLKLGVERVLTERIPEIKEVVAV